MKTSFKRWCAAAGVRALKTAAQTAVALIPMSATIASVGWAEVLGTAALAAVASILTSIAGLPELRGAELTAGTAKEDGGDTDNA